MVDMLKKYKLQSQNDYENALKEIIQEVSLLGLWRSKFFEKAAFYGGSALRILYHMDRFSEDLDFSLLEPNPAFNLTPYLKAVQTELKSFGMNVTIEQKGKAVQSATRSAFIKTGTLENFLLIEAPESFIKQIHSQKKIKIRIEVDIDPPQEFEVEAKYLLQPIPFSVNTYKPPFLFAGKCHALLCRGWKSRVKGRDWYDLVWYVAQNIPIHLKHLEKRMQQSGHWDRGKELTALSFRDLLNKRIWSIDFDQAKADTIPFIKDPQAVEVWSTDFFKEVADRISFV